ncbi:MAG: hypothetical protein KAJ55_01015, partial [Anaerolineales bacterium]|nr:hypothetical protein [Anaerolineales bacterium]
MRSVKTIVMIILLSLGISAVFWTLNSAIMSYVLHSGSFLDQFFQPDMHHLWMRVPVVLLSVPIVTLIIRFGAVKAEVKEMRKLLPICAWCGKKIRDAEGNWKQVEVYIKEYTGADTTHGMCPECYNKSMTELDSKENNNIKVT